MTLLEAVNKVLVGLREVTVANLTATYSGQIVQLINDAKQDLEDMGPWMALRTTISKSLVAGTSTVSLTTETTDRSYLLFKDGQGLAYLTTADKERMLTVVSVEEIQRLQLLIPDQPNDIPCYVAFARANGGQTAHFWPTPDAAYTVKFVFIVPQADLTTSDGSTSFTLPAEPIWRRALVMAMEERGEELSGPIDRAEARAQQATWNAVMMDFGAEPMTFRAE
jgi:hypothetical protein